MSEANIGQQSSAPFQLKVFLFDHDEHVKQKSIENGFRSDGDDDDDYDDESLSPTGGTFLFCF